MNSIAIRRLGPQDWETFREVRLRALRGAPEAYGTSATEAERLTPDDWRQRLAARVAFIGVAGNTVVGLACGIPGEHPGEAELTSMWVEPDWRRQRVGSRLIDAVAVWAMSEGFQRLRLWVAKENVGAERMYERIGFRRTGDVKSMAGGTAPRVEFAMRRELET